MIDTSIAAQSLSRFASANQWQRVWLPYCAGLATVYRRLQKTLQPLAAQLPEGYRIEVAGNMEESGKANLALAKIFPIMFVVMLIGPDLFLNQ